VCKLGSIKMKEL